MSSHVHLTDLERLWILRHRKCWNARQCAEALGVGLTTLRHWDSNQRSPTPRQAETIRKLVSEQLYGCH